MARMRHYQPNQAKSIRFNVWDFVALSIIFALIIMLTWGAHEMTVPYAIGQTLPISLDSQHLPAYAIRTVLRMFIALLFSLLFTFTIGTWAAKSKRAEKILIPSIDILQSVPVLSFLSITIVGFIRLFPGSLLGPELAAIFATFTAQAWNMTLGFYQSLRTVPSDLKEAADMFHLSAWQRFWRIEVPFSTSTLLWNTMMSMSASWFFVVLAEAISVSNQDIRLPGIGSYIALAIEQADKHAVLQAIAAMFIVILFYDQLIFRPLVKWSEKFKFEHMPAEKSYRSWVVSLLQRTQLLRYIANITVIVMERIVNLQLFKKEIKSRDKPRRFSLSKPLNWLWHIGLVLTLLGAGSVLLHFILNSISLSEVWHVFLLGSVTATRVVVLIILSCLIWVPVGVWIGMRPALAQSAQPIIQFLAAFPANLIYPIVVITIVYYQLNVEIWLTVLMMLGAQWYVLFNVIAGAANIPKDLYQTTQNFGVSGWQWWRRLILPGIFPYLITGAITAAGGAWNASIVAELVYWGDTTLRATGLGEYIQAYTKAGDFPRIALGTAMMSLFVLSFNRFIWHPLYRFAEARFKLD